MSLRTILVALDSIVHAGDIGALTEVGNRLKTLDLEGRDLEIVKEFYKARREELGTEQPV